jgi:TATA-box binding protein (TBP) (component of TFIID and TFIIIB)
MSKQIAITLLEQGNSEAPNIGTITGTTENELVHKAIDAIGRHFDADIMSLKVQDNLNLSDVVNSAPLDVYVTIQGEAEGRQEYLLEAQQTWVY